MKKIISIFMFVMVLSSASFAESSNKMVSERKNSLEVSNADLNYERMIVYLEYLIENVDQDNEKTAEEREFTKAKCEALIKKYQGIIDNKIAKLGSRR